MMTPCPPDEILAEILASGAGEERRAHLDSCPRCRARLAAFRAFMDMEPLPRGVDLADARAHLRASIAGAAQDTPVSAKERTRWRFRLGWPSVAGLAAVVLFALLLRVTPGFRAGHDMVLRGPSAVSRATGGLSCTVRPDGSAEFRWTRFGAGERYRVLIADQDLREVARWEAGRDTSFVVGAADVRSLGASGAAIFWRVAVMQGDDEVVRSAPATLRLP